MFIEGRGPLKIFLSSTSRDLADHRNVFIEQCHLYGYDVIAMEEFGAQDAGAGAVSVKEVGPCDLFVGIYAKRYGYVPSGYTQSVTELEYEEAIRLNKPRLAFVVDDDKPLYTLLERNRDDDGETGEKLRTFLQIVGTERVWDRFTSPEDFAKCFHIELAEYLSRIILLISYLATADNADSAIFHWKHLEAVRAFRGKCP